MGQSELQQSYKSWAKRIGLYESQGISANVYGPIAKQDMQRTYSEDSYPMSDLEANIAVAAAASKTPPVTEQPRGTGEKGLTGIVGRVAGNIIPDVGNLITALPRGVFDLGKAVVTPSSYTDTAKLLFGSNEDPALAKNFAQAGVDPTQYDQSGGASSLKNFGATARLVATDPLLSWIPGVSDLAGAATPQGRQSLEQHPVSTVLDLAGDVGGLSKIAGTEALARSGELGKLADSGVDINDPKALAAALKKDPSAKAALAGGHVVQGAARGIDRAVSGRLAGGLTPDISDTSDEGLGVGQKATRAALRKLKLDTANRALSTSMARESGNVALSANRFSRSTVDAIFKELGDDPKAMEAYTRKAEGLDGGWDAMSDVEKAVNAKHHAEVSKMADEAVGRGDLVRTAEGHLFPKGSKAASTYGRLGKSSARASKSQQAVEAATHELTERTREYDEVSTNPDGSHVDASTKGPYSKVGKAYKKVEQAQQVHAAAVDKAAKDSATKDIASQSYQKAKMKTPPANLTPIMRQFMRGKASDLIADHAAANIPADKLAQVQFLDETNQMLKSIGNTTFLKDLKGHLGPEYNKLLVDSLEYAMSQTKDHPPVYVPSIRTGHEGRALSTRISPRTPSNLLEKGFDIADTMMNSRLAVLGQYVNQAQREAGDRVLQSTLLPWGKSGRELDATYQRAAELKMTKGRTKFTNVGDLKRSLRDKEWVRISKRTGTRISRGKDSPDAFYVPKDLMENWEHFTQGDVSRVTSNHLYSSSMKLFRTSVLYGPRHFAHVVIGGLMPVMMAEPGAITKFATLAPAFLDMMKGREPDPSLVPDELRRPIDPRSDEGLQHRLGVMQGNRYAKLLQDFWAKTGARPGEGMAKIEDTMQTMYQAAVRLQRLDKGDDPTSALEAARRVVVNMDSASPFERTVMKQIMPFYSFTRFATLFLLKYPFDHPLRVSILASLSNQAQEEWGTGLPMSMMDLFFIGDPDSSGNETSVNLKNINPFRSIANTFTLGGFVSSLNPGVEAIAGALGVNTLSGSGEMYPEISYNPQTGDLETTRPSGDMWTAIESYVPEFQSIDAYLGLSDSLRSLKQDDPQAYRRELFTWFNIPFTPSNYNLNQVRGNTALNLYKGASQAMQDAQRTGNFSGNINRYNYVPMMSPSGKNELYTPSAVESYYKSLSAQYATAEPGINPAAVNPYTS